MSAKLRRVFQRLRLVDEHGKEWSSRRAAPVLVVLGALADEAKDKDLRRPVEIYVEELVRRANYEKKKRSIQAGLKAAEALGLIHRIKNHGAIGHKQPCWPVLFHEALIQAAETKTPWAGQDLVFPRAWGAVEGPEIQTQLVTRGASNARALNAPKKGCGNHSARGFSSCVDLELDLKPAQPLPLPLPAPQAQMRARAPVDVLKQVDVPVPWTPEPETSAGGGRAQKKVGRPGGAGNEGGTTEN